MRNLAPLLVALLTLSCTVGMDSRDDSVVGTSKVVLGPCSTASDCGIYNHCILEGSISCQGGQCIAFESTVTFPCTGSGSPVTIASSSDEPMVKVCGGWQPYHGAGCRKELTSAVKVGPWISCSARSSGDTVQVNQVRTYVTPQGGSEYLLSTSNYSSTSDHWSALYSWKAWGASPGQDGVVIRNPSDNPFRFYLPSEFTDSKTAGVSYTLSVADVAYHGGTSPHPDLPGGTVFVRVEADLVMGPSVTCQVGADPYRSDDKPDPANDRKGIATSAWVGSTCGSSMTISSKGADNQCIAWATPATTPVATPTATATPVATTTPVPTPTPTCSLYWSTQPTNLTVGNKTTACFTPTSACGTLFRVDVISSTTVVNGISNSEYLKITGSNYCYTFEAFGDGGLIGNLYLRAYTMDGAPSSGSASSATFNVSQPQVVSTPVLSYNYTWTLPSPLGNGLPSGQVLASVMLADVNFNSVCTQPGPFYAGSSITCTIPNKMSTFTWAAYVDSLDKVWSSGYTDVNNKAGSCKVNGSIRVTDSTGSTYTTGVIPYSTLTVQTCRNVIQ